MTENTTATRTAEADPVPKKVPGRKPSFNRKPSTRGKKPGAKKPGAGQTQSVPWGLVRLGVALVLVLLAGLRVYPAVTDFMEEEYSSKAVSKGRVLLRGAQLVATQQMVDGASWEDIAGYLTNQSNLPEIADAAKFPVEPVEITTAQLNDKGILEQFECVLDWENRRYRIALDLTADQAEPTLLEKLDKPKDADLPPEKESKESK